MTTTTANELQDAALAHTDAELVLAGITEIHDAILAGRYASDIAVDITADVLPKLDALRAYLIEQVREVTA